MGNVINLIASPVNAPSGLWVTILNWIEGGIVNYGWTILLFTLLIKFVLLPLDLLIKYSTKKSTLVQKKLAPQQARLQKKFGNNQQAMQAQMNALYKKEGYNMVGSCVIMLVNLVVTMVVFLTMFSSLREVSAYKTINQYNNVQTVYEQTMIDSLKSESTITNFDTTSEEFSLSAWLQDTDNNTNYSEEIARAQAQAKQEVIKTWESSKDSWLWIENIWVADGAKSAMPSYNDLKTMASNSKIGEYNDYVNNLDTYIYEEITDIVGTSETRWNGYYILAVLSALVTFLSQWIAELTSKLKNKKLDKMTQQPQNTGMMKFMKILLPAMMVIFVISSSASFGIYVVTNSIMSILITYLTSLIVNAMTKKKEAEVTEYLEKEALKLAKKNNKKAN